MAAVEAQNVHKGDRMIDVRELASLSFRRCMRCFLRRELHPRESPKADIVRIVHTATTVASPSWNSATQS